MLVTRKNGYVLAKIILCGLVSAILALVGYGCAATEDPGVAAARQLIREGKAECVVVRDGRVAAVERGRGVSPLLNLYTAKPDVLKGGTVVDKVIGRAAGFIIISGGAKAAHGELISEDAIVLLKKHGIAVSGTKIVPRILNRKMNGLCPLEQSVLGLEDPAAAMTSLRRRVADLLVFSEKKVSTAAE